MSDCQKQQRLPTLKLPLVFSEIVFISRVKYFTSDDMTFSYFTSDDMTFSYFTSDDMTFAVTSM